MNNGNIRICQSKDSLDIIQLQLVTINKQANDIVKFTHIKVEKAVFQLSRK